MRPSGIIKASLLTISLALSGYCQAVNLSGTVTHGVSGKPLKDVLVRLKSGILRDTTGADGMYRLTSVAVRNGDYGNGTGRSRLSGNFLEFRITAPSPVTAELFTAAGIRIRTLLKGKKLASGAYRIHLADAGLSPNVYYIRYRNGEETAIHAWVSMGRGHCRTVSKRGEPETAVRAKMTYAVDDTLVYFCPGFSIVQMAISDYSGVHDAVLQPLIPVITRISTGDQALSVVWDPVPNATSYNLYYQAGTTVTSGTGIKMIDTIPPARLIGLSNGIRYAVAVSAVNDAGESALSAVMTAVPENPVDSPSIFFIIDNSGSMVNNPGTDRSGNRFTVPSALLDTLVKDYPDIEVGLSIFGSTLYLDPADHPWFVTCPTQQGAYVPLLKMGRTYPQYNNMTGYQILKDILRTNNGTLLYAPSSNTFGSMGTNITAGFDAAKAAFKSSLNVNNHDKQFVIFLSDGMANVPDSTSYRYETFRFARGDSVPTTFTVFFSTSTPPTYPSRLDTMTTNIRNNGWSSNNDASRLWGYQNTTHDALLQFLMDNVIVLIQHGNRAAIMTKTPGNTKD